MAPPYPSASAARPPGCDGRLGFGYSLAVKFKTRLAERAAAGPSSMDDGAKLEAEGKLEAAFGAYQEDACWLEAAKVGVKLGRFHEAAEHFLRAGQPYEAAVCFQRAQAPRECLTALLEVAPTSPRYRQASVHAIRTALTLGEAVTRLTPFIVPFINSPPQTLAEATALLQFADAFQGGQRARVGKLILLQVRGAFPGAPELAALVEQVAASTGAIDALLPSVSGRFAAVRPADLGPSPTATSGGFAPVKSPTTTGRFAAVSPASISGKQPAVSPSSVSGKQPAVAPTASGTSGKFASISRGGPWLADALMEEKKVTREALDRVRAGAAERITTDLQLAAALVDTGAVPEVDVLKLLAARSGLQYLSRERLLALPEPAAVARLTREQAAARKVMPVIYDGKKLHVAMANPLDVAALDALRFATGALEVAGVFAMESSVRTAILKFYEGVEPGEAEDDWRGKVVAVELGARLSDRFTGTREREFAEDHLDPSKSDDGFDDMEISVDEPAPVAGQAPPAGAVVGGRYELQQRLADTEALAIYQALDRTRGQVVALKLFRRALDEDRLARLQLEVDLSRQLVHPHLIQLFDLGIHEGQRYVTLELLEGLSVAGRLAARKGPLPLVEGLRYLEQACLGLQAAHEQGVIHRDLKPANLFVTRQGVVKVMEFGLAKMGRTQAITLKNVVAGTPEYMSPEQINSFSTVTTQSDLYSLGAAAFEVFTGKPVFQSPAFMEVLKAHVGQKPAVPSSRNPLIPPELDAAILKLLEKHPADRFADARAAGAAFQLIRQALEHRG
jgi:serine/threonine-protein kinase